MITLNDYQARAMATAVYENDLYPLLALGEEVGELQGKFAKFYRGDKDLVEEDIKKEAGDILWQLAAFCNDQGWPLEDVAQLNLDKLADRKAKQVLRGDGDNR